MRKVANCIVLAALTICPPLPVAQLSPQNKTRPQKEPSLISDTRTVLGKVNYVRAKELAVELRKTIRNIKAYQRDIVSTTDRERQHALERMLDEEIGRAIEQTTEVLSFLQEYGFEDVIYKHEEELTRGFSQRSLPPYEKEIFLNAGFSEADFNAFVSLFELHGHEIVLGLKKAGGVSGLKERLRAQSTREKGKRYQKANVYLKISAGGFAVVGDGASAIIFEIAPSLALQMLNSIAWGLSTVADGVGQLSEDSK